MRARLSRLRMRDLASFVVVAGVVAVAALFAAREVGLGDRSAVAEGERLVLTLTPEAGSCTTEEAWEAWGVDRGGQRHTSGWVVTAETALQWHVSGGEAPYTLEIDGQSANSEGAVFSGETGRVTIACTNTSASWRWGEWDLKPARYYTSDPALDSGWKTIEAEVRDANGNSAEATTQFYVIYEATNDLHLLRRGQTYRVFGHLVTIPDGVDMRIGDRISGSGGDSVQTFYIDGTDPFVVIWLNARSFREVKREVPSEDGSGAGNGALYSEGELREFHTAFDLFAGSVGQPPGLDRS